MSAFLSNTIEDMRCGRQNWRVLVLLCSTAFTITFATFVAAH